jgi:glycerol kinase
MISGLTRGTTKAHLCRAALEAIALQNVDLAIAMQSDAGRAMTQLRVDGGAAANDLLLQLQADFLGVPLFRPDMVEATALGAAKLAARGAGVEVDSATSTTTRMGIFNPSMDVATRAHHLERWRQAVAKA